MPQQQKIILDTDLGDDVDDALALGLVLASPELELVGITTVFGNAAARARQGRTLLAVAGSPFDSIPVAVGCSATLRSRPLPAGGMSDFGDPTRTPNQDASCLPEDQLPPPHPSHGVDFLIDTILAGDGDIVPVTIGAMTNLAMALVKQPRIAEKIPRVMAMAGEFARGFAEWNIRCDPEAAAIVFNSGLPIDVIPWRIGAEVARFRPEDVGRMAASDRPIVQRLVHAIRLWQQHHEGGPGPRADARMPSLFDPMAIATLIQPELCRWERGRVRVELQGDRTYGYTTLERRSDGPHRVAVDADREACIRFYLDRVLA